MGVKPDLITYNILAGGYSRNGTAQEAVDLLSDMESQGLKPDTSTYNMIIRGLYRVGKTKEAKAFFDSLEEEKCVVTYSAMVKGYCEAGHTEKAYKLCLRFLSKHQNLVSKNACSNLLSKLCEEEDTQRAFVLFKKMFAMDWDLDEIYYCKIIAVLCRAKNVEMARHVFNLMDLKKLTPDVKTYTIMMNGYCKAHCLQEACNLLDDMQKKGLKPDVITYTVLIDGIHKENRKRRHSSHNSEGTTGKLYDASTLLSEMNIMDITHDVVMYTVLIDRNCKADNLQDARHLFNEMIDRGLTPDAIAYTALMSGYCSKGDVDKAVNLVDEMTRKGLVPDDRTISKLQAGKIQMKKLEEFKKKKAEGKVRKPASSGQQWSTEVSQHMAPTKESGSKRPVASNGAVTSEGDEPIRVVSNSNNNAIELSINNELGSSSETHDNLRQFDSSHNEFYTDFGPKFGKDVASKQYHGSELDHQEEEKNRYSSTYNGTQEIETTLTGHSNGSGYDDRNIYQSSRYSVSGSQLTEDRSRLKEDSTTSHASFTSISPEKHSDPVQLDTGFASTSASGNASVYPNEVGYSGDSIPSTTSLAESFPRALSGLMREQFSLVSTEEEMQGAGVKDSGIKWNHEFATVKQDENFATLEQHIEDLTQAKFSMERDLNASRALAESLATENSSLTDSYNQQLKSDMESLQEEIKAQMVSITAT
ncbi:hypothetical protein IFM89_016348 [Coptis chinensis]|uniref:Pentatricopeptide repeat-containing protein n=1 Tax=Coptis chinensis TaxID=261450 RepID=A0A835HF44_9MAGN|nr:hypothetical protein IFM89_016348 [Coptis chinensis]